MASQEEHLFFPFFLYVFVSGSKPRDILVFSLILVWMPAARARIPRRIPGLLDQTKLEAENEMFLRLFPSNFEKVVKIKKINSRTLEDVRWDLPCGKRFSERSRIYGLESAYRV